MPELPEVETVRKGLEKLVNGFYIKKIDVLKERSIASIGGSEEFINNVQDAFATLGSTLSLHDLLRGVESLQGTDIPLTASQSDAIATSKALAQLSEDEATLEEYIYRDLQRKPSRKILDMHAVVNAVSSS